MGNIQCIGVSYLYTVKKIYYDKVTGERIWDNSYNYPIIVDFDHDYAMVIDLKLRVKDSIGLLVLENGAFAQDFAECTGYRVNVATKELEFSYPDPNAPEEPPVFQKPLSEQVEALKIRDGAMQDDINFIFETLGA